MCSYHAYNRCDAAGVVPKRLAAHEKRQSKGPVGAAAYAQLVNSSSYGNHVAFSFPAINRGTDVFPAELTKLHHARQCCDVLYHRTRADRCFVGDCPQSTLPVDLTQQRAALATPAPGRIQGSQVT